MAILIIAQPGDEHAVAVKGHLERIGNEVEVLDTSLFPEAARLAMRYSCCKNERTLRLDVQGRNIELNRFGSVWWRRPQPPKISEQMVRASHRLLAPNKIYEAWRAFGNRWMPDGSTTPLVISSHSVSPINSKWLSR